LISYWEAQYLLCVKTIEYLGNRLGKNLSKEEIEFAERGHFPYTWFDSLEKFDDPGLPDREYFFNDLTEDDLS